MVSGEVKDGPAPNYSCPVCILACVQKFSLILLLAVSTPVVAQSRFELGLFIDYVGVSQTGTNNFGLGGRFGYAVHRHVMLEGELAYDYGINFDEAYRNVVTGNLSAIEHTSIGLTHGLFGPMFEQSKGHLRPFATFKAGFMDFRLSPSLLPYSDVASAVLGLRTSNLNAAIYPAAGVEATLGPVGLQLEAGEEIYFNHGAHNNLRVTFGPIVRF